MDNKENIRLVKTLDGSSVEVSNDEGKPFASSVRCVEIVQQVKFGFTEDYIESCLDGWTCVKRYSYIYHDKDRKKDGSPKEPHIHLALDFKGPTPLRTVLNRFASDKCYLAFNHLEKCKDGYMGAVAYQTHIIAPEKYQYDSSLVHCNFDFDEEVEAYCEKHGDKDLLEKLLKQIADGDVLEYNIYKHVDVSFYTMFKRRIDDAFEYRALLSSKRDRNMCVIYVHGAPGSGKTLSAQKIAQEIYGYDKEEIYVSSSGKDWIDGYKNEPCFILDDFRPKGTSVPKFLKALDNYCNSRIDSRYHSKNFSECKLMFITSVIPFDSIWANLDQSEFDSENISLTEARKQLERRMSGHIEVVEDKMFYEENVEPFNRYVMPNPAWEQVLAKRQGYSVTDAQKIFRDRLKEQGCEPIPDNVSWIKAFTFRKESDKWLDIDESQLSEEMQLLLQM